MLCLYIMTNLRLMQKKRFCRTLSRNITGNTQLAPARPGAYL